MLVFDALATSRRMSDGRAVGPKLDLTRRRANGHVRGSRFEQLFGIVEWKGHRLTLIVRGRVQLLVKQLGRVDSNHDFAGQSRASYH